ncbi:MAG TPA: ATP-binding protein, partial [Polyangiaceae bacterium]|nr:ATP-binding protein [Polyangiaceae bacterium]
LRGVADAAQAASALAELETVRGVLPEIVDAPEHALATLRLVSGAPARPSHPPLSVPLPLPPKRPTIEVGAESDARALTEEGTVRVSSTVLEALFERVGQVSQLRGPLSSGSSSIARGATSVRDVARDVREALRMIGPPRPWGAPAAAIVSLEKSARALDPVATRLDALAGSVASVGGRLGREGYSLSSTVASLRTTTASVLFDRVATATQSEARRMDRAVDVVVAGGETPIDRRLVEALLEPLRQLARNAIVHGLEPPEERTRLGKDPRGTVRLAAEPRAGSLVITVSDDGAGVDIARVRENATSAGLVSTALADGMSDGALLSLLFFPGFSMRAEADLLAGRGVGLDLALAAVHRIGGTIHLDSRRGLGLTARVVVPTEGAMVRVVWLESAGATYALAVQHTGEVRLLRDADDAVSLATLLRSSSQPSTDRYAIEIHAPFEEGARLALAVSAVGSVDEVAIRALPSVARALGPWSGAVVWADDLRLAIDPTRLIQLARSAA